MKKIFLMAMAMALISVICSVSVFATDATEDDSFTFEVEIESLFALDDAKIGETKYKTLQEALDAAQNGETITILRDITLENTIVVAKGTNAVIDMAGKTISQTVECTASYEMIANNGTLSIMDSVGGGKISFTDTSAGDPTASWGAYTIRNNGTLVVSDVTIENLSAQNVAGQPFKHTTLAIFQYSGSCTINSGVISCPSYRSVRLWMGEMIINGGTFDGQVWFHCVNDNGSLTVNGGEFSPNGNDGSSLFVNNVSGANHYDVSLSITGGEFATKIGCSDVTAFESAITGGEFSAKAIASMGKDSGLFSMPLEQNADGTYSLKETVELTDIFKWLGYSVPESNPNAITAGYEVKQKFIDVYCEQEGIGRESFDFGCAFGIDTIREDKCQSFKSYTSYKTFNVKIRGINPDREDHIKANLLLALYIDLGEGKSYVVQIDGAIAIVDASEVPSVTFESFLSAEEE